MGDLSQQGHHAGHLLAQGLPCCDPVDQMVARHEHQQPATKAGELQMLSALNSMWRVERCMVKTGVTFEPHANAIAVTWLVAPTTR